MSVFKVTNVVSLTEEQCREIVSETLPNSQCWLIGETLYIKQFESGQYSSPVFEPYLTKENGRLW